MKSRYLWFSAFLGFVFVGTVTAAPVILNEFNAVSSGNYLDGSNYSDRPDRGDSFFATVPGITNGRIQGNGGNWIELVVTEDHVDVRGWELRWAERASTSGTGNIWTGTATQEQGIITLTDANIWSDLRSGTIITISERQVVRVDTTVRAGERNFTAPSEADGTYEASIDLSTDVSYDPARGDWWIHVSTLDERDSTAPLLRTVTNRLGDSPGNFTVGNDDWQVTFLNTADAVTFGPVGEGQGPLNGINNEEVGKLEADPSPLIVPTSNYNDGTSSTFGAPNSWANGLVVQDFSTLRSVMNSPPKLLAGDADQDLDFDQFDLIKVQIAAKYLTGQAATWGDGDWNGAPGGAAGRPPAGDRVFNQLDIVAAQQAGVYLQGTYSAVRGSSGQAKPGQTSVVRDAQTVELAVSAGTRTEVTSIDNEPAPETTTGSPARNQGGSFDNNPDVNILNAIFASDLGTIRIGHVAQRGLSDEFVHEDPTVLGSFRHSGMLGDMDRVYIPVPEPAAVLLLALGLFGMSPVLRRGRRTQTARP